MAVRTAVISDLHLGSRLRSDLLRHSHVRERLLEALRGADRLLLLGDTLELRDRPIDEVLEVARPFFNAVGEGMRDGEVVLVPGNHDHRIITEARAGAGARTAHLGLADRFAIPEGSIAARIRK